MRRTLLGAAVPIALLAIGGCTTDGTTEPGGPPVTINWSVCTNDANFPSWVAFQDGTGAWARVTPVNGVFTFTVNSGKAGYAEYAGGALTIVYATSDEFSANVPTCSGSRRTASGTVTGYSLTDALAVQMDHSNVSLSGTTAPPAGFQLSNIAPGPVDLLAVKSRATTTTSTYQQTPSAVFIRRAQSTSPMAVVDFNSTTESGAPLQKTVTISNAGSNEDLLVFAGLSTLTTSITTLSVSVTSLGTVTGNVSGVFYGLPSSRLTAGDNQMLEVFASKTVSSSVTDQRYVTTVFTDAADKAGTLLATLVAPTVTGTARPGATYTFQTGYDQIFELDLNQGSRAIQVIKTRGYVGASATNVTVAVPDLSGVTGFVPTWLLTPGSTATWTFFAASATLGAYSNHPQSYTAASRTANFTP